MSSTWTEGAAANSVTFGSGTGISFSTGATQYYGRLYIGNPLGSELLDLPMSLTTQYYLNAGETCVRDTGSPGASGSGCAAAATSTLRHRSAPVAGDFNLILVSPGSGSNGAVTNTATAPSWLKYLWNASCGVNSNPAGTTTFGLFPGPKSRVYTREVY